MSEQAKPRYLQLKELIIGQISGELNDEGYVERVAGVGTFVADFKAVSHVLEVRNIADEIDMRGHSHAATVLVQEQSPAGPRTANALRIDEGSEVFRLVLIHHENAIPIQVEHRFVLMDFAPDCLEQDFTTITPSAYLSAISPLQEAEHVVRAVMPDDEIKSSLEMGDGEPCLVVSRRTWAHGRPVTFARLYHPGSRFELSGHYVPPGTESFSRAGDKNSE
jgi:GntR family histidine utilization transcriptional repressor